MAVRDQASRPQFERGYTIMTLSRLSRGAAMALALSLGTGAAGAAQAEFFVRPVLQYGGEMQDGLSLNDLTSRSATFNDGSSAFEAHVDLGEGTIKTFLQMNGPGDTFGGATGIMGDQIRYTGSGDEAVAFRYDYDALISANQEFTGTPEEFDSRYIGIEAHFAIYEAGSGATWADWTAFGTQSHKALFVDYDITTFQHEPGVFSLSFADAFETELYLTSGRSYDIFAAFNLIATPGAQTGSITMDALNTSRIGIVATPGSLTSQSGEFLGFAQTPVSAVPEPATWAMLIMGFGFVGSALRRRRPACAA